MEMQIDIIELFGTSKFCRIYRICCLVASLRLLASYTQTPFHLY